MAILLWRANPAGQNDQHPRIVELFVDDTIAVATAAGYLNNWLVMNSQPIYASDFVHLAASNGTQIYKPSISNGGPFNGGSVQLVALG